MKQRFIVTLDLPGDEPEHQRTPEFNRALLACLVKDFSAENVDVAVVFVPPHENLPTPR